MKIKRLLTAVATVGTCLTMVACTDTATEYVNKTCDLIDDATETLLDCKEWNDAFDTADDLHAIAEDLEEVNRERRLAKNEIEEDALDMTPKEYNDYIEALDKKRNESKEAFNKAVEHIKNTDAKQSKYLKYAISRISHYL